MISKKKLWMEKKLPNKTKNKENWLKNYHFKAPFICIPLKESKIFKIKKKL